MNATEVTVTLKAAMTVEQYQSDPEAVKSPLRTELGCHEPLCVLTVTVASGSLILTVVATDRAPNSQVHSLATAMGTSDLSTLSASLNITLTEAPAVQPARSVQIVVVLLAPSPPPPSPPPLPPTTPPGLPPTEPHSPSPPSPPSDTPPPPPGSTDGSEGDISMGMIAGIGVGAIVLVLIVVTAAFCVIRANQKPKPPPAAQSRPPHMPAGQGNVAVPIDHAGEQATTPQQKRNNNAVRV